jgi:hypothetical protein
MTGFIVSVFLFRNRVSPKEAFEGLEPGEGKPSRPVLRGPGGLKTAWLLGSNPSWLENALSVQAASTCPDSNCHALRIMFRVALIAQFDWRSDATRTAPSCVTGSTRNALSCVRPQRGVFRALFNAAEINHVPNVPKPQLKRPA